MSHRSVKEVHVFADALHQAVSLQCVAAHKSESILAEATQPDPGSTTEVVHESQVGAREYPSDLGEYGLAKVVFIQTEGHPRDGATRSRLS